MEGWSVKERKRVERNFAVFKQAQEREEQRRAKKAKGSKWRTRQEGGCGARGIEQQKNVFHTFSCPSLPFASCIISLCFCV